MPRMNLRERLEPYKALARKRQEELALRRLQRMKAKPKPSYQHSIESAARNASDQIPRKNTMKPTVATAKSQGPMTRAQVNINKN